MYVQYIKLLDKNDSYFLLCCLRIDLLNFQHLNGPTDTEVTFRDGESSRAPSDDSIGSSHLVNRSPRGQRQYFPRHIFISNVLYLLYNHFINFILLFEIQSLLIWTAWIVYVSLSLSVTQFAIFVEVNPMYCSTMKH